MASSKSRSETPFNIHTAASIASNNINGSY